jgi:micrococcal nuclease
METPFQNPTYTYRVKEVLRVVDGDTVDVLIDVGFKTYLSKRLRFLGIDTWEVRGEEREKGLIAKARLEELLASAKTIYVQTVMDAEGKYGRVLAWVWIQTDTDFINVSERLLVEGHGTVA